MLTIQQWQQYIKDSPFYLDLLEDEPELLEEILQETGDE